MKQGKNKVKNILIFIVGIIVGLYLYLFFTA